MASATAIDKSDPSLHLIIPPFQIHLAQYPVDVSIPPSIFGSHLPFLSITRSPGETTILHSTTKAIVDQAEEDGGSDVLASLGLPEPLARDGPYAVLRIRGPLDLTLTGILNELTIPLREAFVPIYAVSTWNTDYVLVPSPKLEAAKGALTKAGWTFGEA